MKSFNFSGLTVRMNENYLDYVYDPNSTYGGIQNEIKPGRFCLARYLGLVYEAMITDNYSMD